MTDAIILDPQGMDTVKRQCERCRHWDWFKGCFYTSEVITVPMPIPLEDCGAFEETR